MQHITKLKTHIIEMFIGVGIVFLTDAYLTTKLRKHTGQGFIDRYWRTDDGYKVTKLTITLRK